MSTQDSNMQGTLAGTTDGPAPAKELSGARGFLGRADWAIVPGLFAVVIAGGVIGISRQPWPSDWDATDYAIRGIELKQAMGKGLGEVIRHFPGSHGPLMPALNMLAFAVAPWANAFWAMTAVQLILLGLTGALGYLMLRRFLGIGPSLLMISLYLLAPMHAYWATQIMYEGSGNAMLAALLLACMIDQARRNVPSALLVGACLGLLALTRLNYLVPAGAAFLPYAAWRVLGAPKGSGGKLALCLLLPVVLTAGAWYTVALRSVLECARRAYAWPSAAPTGGSWLETQLLFLGYLWREWGICTPAVVCAGIAGAIVFLARRGHWRDFPAGWVHAGVVVILLLLCLAMKQKNERFIGPALLPCLVMLAWAVRRVPPNRAARAGVLGAMVLAGVLQLASFVDRFVAPLPAAGRWALYGDPQGPQQPIGAGEASKVVFSAARGIVSPDTRVLFIGYSRDLNSVIMKYWNTLEGRPLNLEYGFVRSSPEESAQDVSKRIQDSGFVIFCRAGESDAAAYREFSPVAEKVLKDLAAAGRASEAWADRQRDVTIFRIR